MLDCRRHSPYRFPTPRTAGGQAYILIGALCVFMIFCNITLAVLVLFIHSRYERVLLLFGLGNIAAAIVAVSVCWIFSGAATAVVKYTGDDPEMGWN